MALVQILLRQQFGLWPQVKLFPIGNQLMESTLDCDAILLIGDRAIHSAALQLAEQWDLGEQWCCWTGLPFVFAMWTAHKGVDTGELASVLSQSRDAGLADLDRIARDEAAAVGLDARACLAYLRENLHFTLGAEERQGLQLFHRYARQYGFIPGEVEPPEFIRGDASHKQLDCLHHD